MWKYPRRGFAYGAVLLVAASLLAGCGSSKPRKQPQGSVVVKADKPGTYRLGDLTVTAPAGAVPRDTRLTATKPVAIDRQSAPLGAASVQFDLSFAGGLEPAKPLDIAIPLRGSYLPSGANPAQALLYTPALDGRGQRLVPATVDANNVLHAQLVHLSPKTVTYADDQDLMSMLGIVSTPLGSLPNCQTSVSTSFGKVQFTGANKGWSNKDGSPVVACLAQDGSNAKLNISNRLNYIMAVAATNGLNLSTTTADANEAIVKKLADALFVPDKAIKAYLGRGGELTTSLPQTALPATVQLKADPSTFLAEAIWSSVKFLVGVMSAKRDSELLETADTVLGVPDTIDCLKTVANTAKGQTPSLLGVLELVSTKCTEAIAKQIGNFVYGQNLWSAMWNRIAVVAEGIAMGWKTLTTAANGIVMQFVGTLSVVVDREAPKCPSDAEVLAILAKVQPEKMRILPGTKVCEGSWMYVNSEWGFDGSWSSPFHLVLRYVGHEWTVYVYIDESNAREDHARNSHKDKCSQLPPKILTRLSELCAK